MKRVQVLLTDRQLEALRKRAAETGEGIARSVRSAVDDWLARQERDALWERAIGQVGGFHSGLGDLAERHDDYAWDDE